MVWVSTVLKTLFRPLDHLLLLDGGGLTLDLTNISNIRIQDIEKIDITGSGNNTLILNLNDLFDASLYLTHKYMTAHFT